MAASVGVDNAGTESSDIEAGKKRPTPKQRICFSGYRAVRNHTSSVDGRLVCSLFIDMPDPLVYPDYALTVRRPMALRLIKQRLRENKYRTVELLAADMLRVFANARLYNREDTQVYADANELEGVFNTAIAAATKELDPLGLLASATPRKTSTPARSKSKGSASRAKYGADDFDSDSAADDDGDVGYGAEPPGKKAREGTGAGRMGAFPPLPPPLAYPLPGAPEAHAWAAHLILASLATPMPLHFTEIAARAVDTGLVAPNNSARPATAAIPPGPRGKGACAVAATMAAHISGDDRFTCVAPGVYALAEWVAANVVFDEAALAHAVQAGMAPKAMAQLPPPKTGATATSSALEAGETAAGRRKRWDAEGVTVASLHRTTHTGAEYARVGRIESDQLWLRRLMGFRDTPRVPAAVTSAAAGAN